MSTATLTSKGQMTLPKDVRDDLRLKPGDKVEFVKVDGRYELRPRNIRAADLAGFLGRPPNGRRVTIEEMDEGIAQAVAENYRRTLDK